MQHEIDFYIPEINTFIQVARYLETDEVIERETGSLIEASSEHEDSELLIITESERRIINRGGKQIAVVPLYDWLYRQV